MVTLNRYCRDTFGQKLYRLSLDAGFTCPNRDGTIGTRGCLFCSEDGSGDFAARGETLDIQIEHAKEKIRSKYRGNRFIAYFQAFTNTYAPVSVLRDLYFPVIMREDIAVLAIATRPDCLGDDVLALLFELNAIKPIWIELGLQTVHERTAAYIRRGYALPAYDRAVKALRANGIHTVTHVILGLPGETREDMLETVRYVADSGSDGIKLHLLQILRGTDLETEYLAGRVPVMDMDTYLSLVCDCLSLLPPDTVVHRMTGDGPKKLLLAPAWCANKRLVHNRLRTMLRERGLIGAED